MSALSDLLLDRFLEYVTENGTELYPAQEEAILELYSGKNVILNTPTGSGKSLVATALHFKSLAEGRRSFYTCPIKALVNEKFLALCRDFGPDQVGMITGDATVNPGAPIICCTAEILSNDALRMGSDTEVHDVIMDEFHYYSDRERGVAWQIPLLSMPQTRFLLMSATLGETEFFEKKLTWLNERETVVVRSADRPVPLDFQYAETPLHETLARLIQSGKAPIYLVNFSQRECAEEAQNLLSVDFCTKDEKKAIQAELEGVQFKSPYGKEIQKIIKHGIGLHHAGLLPKYRVLVERLAQKGMLKIISGTDTLGVGVNVPIRTVLFTKLCKYDGEKTGILTVRDFQQISGRAGRRGFDTQGTVVAQAPEHVVENLKNEGKAAGDAKKLKKLVKRKPPEKGYVPWTKETFEKLIHGKPEALVSRFQVSHAMVLNVLSRAGREKLWSSDRPESATAGASAGTSDPCKALQLLIRNSHETPVARRRLGKTAFQLFRSLVDRKIVEFGPLRVNLDLQQDFSLNQTLSLYLLDAIKCLDPEAESYAFDLLTLVESILENPEQVLRKQLDRLKTIRMAEMKNEGVEYDARIEELEKMEYPKPNSEFIYRTFNEFSAAHPWVGQENIRPKSVAREMYENFYSFAEYIREYDLQRVEGILLRYLSDVYKALMQTVPDEAKNEEIGLMADYLGSLVRNVDSSLLDEWEKMRNPGRQVVGAGTGSEADDPEVLRAAAREKLLAKKAFVIAVRNEVFRFVRALALEDYEAAAELCHPFSADAIKAMLQPYYTDHQQIRTDPPARSQKNTRLDESSEKSDGTWLIEQTLIDPEEHNDWSVHFKLNLALSREKLQPCLELIGIGSLALG
ncbi:MAG: DUF3516 domain-containing protein [Methylotenera sp.]|nr:DUF3516 domain-containing protein [Oligoflexia bacterium]